LYRLAQLTAGRILRLAFPVSCRGLNTIPRNGPVILASNHNSNLDPLLVFASMHRPVFHISKHTLFKNPLMGFVLGTLGGQIPVDLDAGGNQAGLEAAVGILEHGLALGIYPEGNRSPDGKLQRGRPGAAMCAYLTGAPIYPVAIHGTFEAWPRHRNLPHPFRKVRILVGNPIHVPKDLTAADQPKSCLQLTDDIMVALAQLLGQEYERSKVLRLARPSR
jgi:1-acyl-sn-glycerol-3-phosphate acyltransferase